MGPPTRRSRRGELPAPLALKYFTRGALLEALEARGWRQFPASGLHTWVYYTPEGLERRANKEPTVLNVDYVLDDDGLYAYVELHGILDELVRDKEAAEATAKAAPGHSDQDSPLWLNPSSPPPLRSGGGATAASEPSAKPVRSADSELEDQGFIPTSDSEEDEAQDERRPSSKPSTTARKRPRLRIVRTTGDNRPGKKKTGSGVSTTAARPTKGRTTTSQSSSSLGADGGKEDAKSESKAATIEREYTVGKRKLQDLETELEALEQRVKKQRFHVHKLRIERDCHRERQRRLRELEEQFFGRDAVKKEPSIGECD